MLGQAAVHHGKGQRQWGFDHIITKKEIDCASTDFGLIALAYNLKRLMNLGSGTKALALPCFCKSRTLN